MIIAYGVILGISLLLLLGYFLLVKEKETWMAVMFVSVAVANTGYLLEAVSRSHALAVFANDMTYCGAISVMLSTLLVIVKLCGFTPKRRRIVLLAIMAVIMFLIVCLHPVLPLYYRSTWIEVQGGVTFLKKDYGPLYPVYMFYLFGYLIAMVATIVYSIKKKTICSYKIAAQLFFVAFAGCIVWRVQKGFQIPFNMLSASYVLGESILLHLFWMIQDYVHKKQVASPEPIVIEKVVEKVLYVEKDSDEEANDQLTEKVELVLHELNAEKRLTETEKKVLLMLLREAARKEISTKLSVSENTVKSHISHIYAKLGVGSKEELRALFADVRTDEPNVP